MYYVYQYDPEGNRLQTEDRFEYPQNSLDTAVYDAYGKLTSDIETNTGGPSPSRPSIGYGGEWGNYTEPETDLLCLGHRYYDPGTGRFLNRDPIGYSGGINLYGYAGNNPVNGADPEGTRDPSTAELAVLAIPYKWLRNYDVLDVVPATAHEQMQELDKAEVDVKKYISTLPAGSIPANLHALYWAITQLNVNWGTGHTAYLPGFAPGSGADQCNYFVSSAYLIGASETNWPSDAFSLRHLSPEPDHANTLASRCRVDHTKIVAAPLPGDIVAFHSPSDSGHATIYFGGDLLIYAGGIGIGKIGTFSDVMADGHATL